MCDVIDLYKYGIKDNPWNKLSISELKTAEEDFRKRVKGQDYAIVKTLDIIKRAVTGMSGVQTASHGKPKGVLFFAGPTGTGKTETAKTLAEKLFGDEKCCIRFDMSEYGQSHSDQKLLGAPPGYEYVSTDDLEDFMIGVINKETMQEIADKARSNGSDDDKTIVVIDRM